VIYVQKRQRAAQAQGDLLIQEAQKGQDDDLLEPEDLAAVRITGYFVGVGRTYFEFMDWIKLWITGFLDLVQFIASYSM
jgi:hypothetical protein